MKGIVIKSTGSWYSVIDEQQEVWECRIKGKFRLSGIKSTNPIAVGDYVDFGASSLALGKIRIGNYAVIGAGSVIIKDVPDHAVAAGNPGRVIRILS